MNEVEKFSEKKSSTGKVINIELTENIKSSGPSADP